MDLVTDYNKIGLQLIEFEVIEPHGFHVLDKKSAFCSLLSERYTFFQGYLDNLSLIHDNSFFIIGGENEYNALAIASPEINVISINSKVFTGNYMFYHVKKNEINKVLFDNGIDLFYDNGLETTEIMLQTAEMYVFYHEYAHLIQINPPKLLSRISDEKNIGSYDLVDHVAEIDADLFASMKIVQHIFEINKRENHITNTIRVENLCAIIIAAFLLFRNLIIGNEPKFYTTSNRHPHIAIRMFASIADITNSIQEKSKYEVRRDRIISLALKIMDRLCILHPELQKTSDFVSIGRENILEIQNYYLELLETLKVNKATVYYKINENGKS